MFRVPCGRASRTDLSGEDDLRWMTRVDGPSLVTTRALSNKHSQRRRVLKSSSSAEAFRSSAFCYASHTVTLHELLRRYSDTPDSFDNARIEALLVVACVDSTKNEVHSSGSSIRWSLMHRTGDSALHHIGIDAFLRFLQRPAAVAGTDGDGNRHIGF